MAIRPGSLRAWILASRPATLSAAMVPVAVGTAVSELTGGARFLPALAALLGATWIQIATNFANDVFDYKKGADTEARVGPLRAAQSGLLSPQQLFRGMFVAFAIATLCGIYLIGVAGWPIAVVGILSVLSGIAYTGGPFPLGYNGLGDVFVLVFFGFVAVCGTAYVQVGTVPPLAIWASIPVGALATSILVVNNIRDADSDATCKKRTLAVRFGRDVARGEYLVLITLAFIIPAGLALSGSTGISVLLCWMSIPMAIPLVVNVFTKTQPDVLNRTLKGSAKLLLVHGALFALGLFLAS